MDDRPLRLAVAFILMASPSALAAGAEGAAPLALIRGPRAVGFRVLNHRDATRRTADGALRPVQVSLWYPAAGGDAGPALRYRDYVLVSARERTLAAPSAAEQAEALARYRAFLEGNGVPAAAVAEWLEAPMAARADAPSENGSFPLVLLAQGAGGAVQDQAALAEFLASHGFVVATTPSPLRLGARMESEADVPAVAEEQSRDLDLALAVASQRRIVDRRRLALVGYSFGARAALLMAGRTPAVRALVSLDGGIGSRAAKGWLAREALDRGALRTPILHVYEDGDEASRPDFELLASLARAPRTLVKIAGLRHTDFITFGVARALIPSLGADDRERLGAGIRAAFTVTRAFLEASIAGDGRDWSTLIADGSAFPPGLVQIIPFGSDTRAAPVDSRRRPN